jgi:hypothetical protein
MGERQTAHTVNGPQFVTFMAQLHSSTIRASDPNPSTVGLRR